MIKLEKSKGFTLIELLVALAIVGTILLAFFKIIDSTNRMNVKNDRDIKALNIAQSEIENLRSQIKEKSGNNERKLFVYDNSLDSNLQDILSKIYSSLKQTYAKDYLYQYLSLQLDSNALILILLIPQSLPKLFKEPYKNYEYKDYGIGKYHYLYNHCTFTAFKIEDSMQVGLDFNPNNATILTLHTPYKAQRLEIELANGLDSIIESRDRGQIQHTRDSYRKSTTQSQEKDSQHSTFKATDAQNNTEQQIVDSLLTLQVINGGYRQKYWGFGEEIQENLLQADIDKENRESKETQEKEKQITEIYFSYGEDKIKLKDISRHSQDINLHIRTQGYNEGERLDLTLEFQGKTYQTTATIRNNQATILNIFNES